MKPSFVLQTLILFIWTIPAFARTPNILILYADDMGIGDAGCYGCQDIRTPNIDALAKSGVRFTNYYSAAPVCSASRAALLTGRYPLRCGVPSNVGSSPGSKDGLAPEEITLAEVAKTKGYATGLIGKWHLGFESPRRPNDQGFDYFFGFKAGCIDYYSHMFYWQDPPHHDLFRNNEELHLEGRYMTEMIAQEAGRFIDQHRQQPFLLYVAFNAPHYPMQAPERFIEQYSKLPPKRRIYAAMVSALDAAIGQIVRRLDDHQIAQDTLIFFASDNGATTEMRGNGGGGSNTPYRGFKFSLFDGGIHLPGIVSWRNHIPAGEVRDQLVCAIDWFPTAAEAIEAKPPADRKIDGISWWPLLHDINAAGHDALFWKQGPQSAVRRGKWKLVLNGVPPGNGEGADKPNASDASFLSDLSADPAEQHNVGQANREIVQDLQKLHTAWLEDAKAKPASPPKK